MAHVLGVARPKVAILSAVETVTDKLRSTLDAAAFCKMADRGQITGGDLDGPLAFDNAISLEAARTKGIVSTVAGQADILLVPDLEAGNMLAKQLTFFDGADGAGIVLGARLPIILTSRADPPRTRLASAALALLLVQAKRAGLIMDAVLTFNAGSSSIKFALFERGEEPRRMAHGAIDAIGHAPHLQAFDMQGGLLTEKRWTRGTHEIFWRSFCHGQMTIWVAIAWRPPVTALYTAANGSLRPAPWTKALLPRWNCCRRWRLCISRTT